MTNLFDDKIIYNQYRSIKDILKPSISKKNITNYRIILEDYLYPLRIYYPKKLSDIKNIVLYIHGNSNNKYSDILHKISINTNTLIIGIDYNDDDYNKMYLNVLYIYNELLENNVDKDSIYIMGDSTGCDIIYNIINKNILDKDIDITKIIMFYPVINYLDIEYKDYPKNLLFISKTDKERNNVNEYYNKLNNKSKFVEYTFASHDFLFDMDKNTSKDVFNNIKDFLN